MTSEKKPFASSFDMLSGIREQIEQLTWPTRIMREQIEQLTRPTRIMREQIEQIEQLTRPARMMREQIEQIEQLTRPARMMNDAFSGIREQLTWPTGIMHGPFEQLVLPARIINDAFSGMQGLESALHRQFDFKIPKIGIGELAAPKKLQMPGFQMAAALGLARRAPQGVIASVLHCYNEKNDEAPTFDMVLEAAYAIDENDFTPDTIQRCCEWIWSLIAKERDVITQQGLIKLFITIFMFYLTYQTYGLTQKGATSQDILTQTSAFVEGIHSEVLALQADNHDRDAHIRYIRRNVNLRMEPNGKSALLKVIYPDQFLRALDQQGDWVKVEVFEYSSEKHIVGWVNRRYLYRVQ